MSSYKCRSVALLSAGLFLLAPAAAWAGPDLECTITQEVDGFQVTLTTTITNTGDADAINDFFDGGFKSVGFVFQHSIGTPDISAGADDELELEQLGPTETIKKVSVFNAVTPGDYKAWAVLNPDLDGLTIVTEDDYDNNDCSVSYTIEEPPPAEIDLVVTNIGSKPADCPQALEGKICSQLSVTAENIGGLDATAFSVDVFVQSDQPDFPNLTPAQSTTFCDFPGGLEAGTNATADCTLIVGFDGPGQHTAWAYVDFVGFIVEANDEANGANHNVLEDVVIAVGPPDLVVADLAAAQAGDGDPVKFSALVSNIGGSDCLEGTVKVYWQRSEEPNIVLETPDFEDSLPKVVAGGASILISAEQDGAIGGNWAAYVYVDCTAPDDELSEENNSDELQYVAQGVPNEDPVLIGVVKPDGCHETELCQWTIQAEDTTATPLSYAIANGPLGMWVNSTGEVFYAPPLGGTAENVSVSFEVSDKANAKVVGSFSFQIVPPEGFEGKVAAANTGQMPLSQGTACPLVEIPGTGFAYVDRGDYSIRFFHLPSASSGYSDLLKISDSYNPESKNLSCHLEPLTSGGFAAFDLDNSTVLYFGQDGTPRGKLNLNALTSGLYADMFRAVGDSSLAFIDVSQPPRVVVVDTASGQLDPTWGGNLDDEVGTGTPGILELHDGSNEVFPYEFYLHPGDGFVRIYNRYFDSEALIDYAADGSILGQHVIGEDRCSKEPNLCTAAVLPVDNNKQDNPPWFLLAAHDGGMQVVDLTSATLQWYDGAFEPMSQFTLPEPGADSDWPAGWVSLQEYGVSVNNVRCEPITGGGFSCHNNPEQRGYIIDAFGSLWENCPILDVSPGALTFGGVPKNGKKAIDVTVYNKGGGVLEIEHVTFTLTSGSEGAGFFNQTGLVNGGSGALLFPNQSTQFTLTYNPSSIGVHTGKLTFVSNACDDIVLPVSAVSGSHIQVSPSPVIFQGVPPGQHTQILTVKSVGSEPVIIGALTLNNDGGTVFSADPSSLDANLVLEPGLTWDIAVTFDGDASGEFTGSLVLESNSSSGKDTVVDLFGTTAPIVRAEPAGFNFEAVQLGATRTRSVVVRNDGPSSITFKTPKLSASASFELDLSGFVKSVAKTTPSVITLRYSPSAEGTETAVIVLEHDDPTRPPLVLEAIAGTGTKLPEAFDGQLHFKAENGGPYADATDIDRAAIELSTGGFAAYSNGSIFVIDGSGGSDGAFGVNGRLDITGVNGAFPGATGLGGRLIELNWGGFGLLSPDEQRVYCVGPSGMPNLFIGQHGIIELIEIFPTLSGLANVMVHVDNGSLGNPFAVIDPVADQVLMFHGDMTADANIATLGVLPAFGGATGLGDTLAKGPSEGLVYGATGTKRFYALSPGGKQLEGESKTDIVAAFDGELAAYSGNTLLYYRAEVGLVSRHGLPTSDFDLNFGQAGTLDLSAPWPNATFGGAVVGMRSGLGFAVTDTECDCLLFVANDGEVLELLPEYSGPETQNIDFGIVPVGTTSPVKAVPITNNGKYPLTVFTKFSNLAFHLADGTLKLVVPPGQTADLQLVLTPPFPGDFEATVELFTNDPANPNPAVINLTGTTGPHICYQPGQLMVDFGVVQTGLVDADQPQRSVTLCNNGAGELTLEKVSLKGAAFAMVKTPPPGTLVAPGSQKVATVRCDPPSHGVFYGSLSITHDDPSQPELLYGLVCRSGPLLEVTPAKLDCTASVLGKQTLCGTVSIQNVGSAPLTLYDATADSGFSLGKPFAQLELLPGAQPAQIKVLTKPLVVGKTSGTLTFIHGGVGALGSTKVPLSVRVAGALQVVPGALDFGAIAVGEAVTKTVTLTNNGGLGEAKFIAATPSPAAAFQVIAAPPIGTTIDEGESLQITVQCKPDAAGAYSSELAIATDAPGFNKLTVSLDCISGALVVAEPMHLAFGPVAANAEVVLPVTFTNVGLSGTTLQEADTQTLTPAGVDKAFTTPGLLIKTLGPGESTQAAVQLAASADGDYTGVLSVDPLTVGQGKINVPLTGFTGPGLALVAGGDPLDFGVQPLGSTTTRTALVVNVGTTTATVVDVNFVGAPGPYTFVDKPQGLTLAPGESAPVVVQFAPASIGSYPATLQVTGENDPTLALTGKSGGLLSVTPGTLAFGEVPQGTTEELPILVTNLSPSTSITVKYFAIGSDIFQVIGGDPNGVVLAPGEQLDLAVSASPTQAGEYALQVTFFTDQGVEDASQDVFVTAKSGAAARLIYPITGFHGFGGVPLAGQAQRPIRIASVGAAAVNVLGVALEGNGQVFSVGGFSNPPMEILTGTVGDLSVTCTPSGRGSWDAVLHVATDDPQNADIPIALHCSTPADITVQPRKVDFGAAKSGAVVQATVQLNNKGFVPVSILSAVVLGADGLVLATPVVDQGIAAGGSHELTVRFTAGDGGASNGVLVITTTDPVAPTLEVPLAGWSGSRLTIEPKLVNFCNTTAPREVTLTNTGVDDMLVEGAAFAGVTLGGFTFAFQDDEAEFVLTPDESRTLTVTYDGTISFPQGQEPANNGEAQVAAADVLIQSNDPMNPISVLRLIGGNGLKFENFNGVANLGPPGAGNAFADANTVGAGLAELCTGGLVAAGVKPSRLYFTFPEPLGAASALEAWGADPAYTQLAGLVTEAQLDAALAQDLGAMLSSDDGLTIVGSSSAAAYLFVHGDGTLAAEVGGGVLDLHALLDETALAGGAIARWGSGYVVAERSTARLIFVDNGLKLLAEVGDNGVISLPQSLGLSGAFGEGLAVTENGEVAALDGITGVIVVVDPGTGQLAPDYGLDGVVNLKSVEGFGEGPFGLGGPIAAYDTGFVATDLATGRLLFVLAGGQANISVAGNGVIQVNGPFGAFGQAGALGHGLVITSVTASETGTGKFVLMDDDMNDLLFADDDGSVFAKDLPELSVDPCVVTLSDVEPGGAAATASVTLKNVGDAFLNVKPPEGGVAIEVSTDQVLCVEETISCEASTPIEPGSSRVFNLIWAPTEPGCAQHTFTVYHDGVNGPSSQCLIELGTQESFEVTPSQTYVYPPQSVGTAFTKEFLVRNTGCQPFTLQNSDVGGAGKDHFQVDSGVADGGSVVEPGGIHKVKVTCQPQADGEHSANLTFTIAGLSSPDEVVLTCLTGPSLSFIPAKLNFGELPIGTGAVKDVTLTNNGGKAAELGLDQLTLCPTNQLNCNDAACIAVEQSDEYYDVVPPLPGATLPVGSSAKLRVKFAPQDVYECPSVYLCVPYGDGLAVSIPLCGWSAPDLLIEWTGFDGEIRTDLPIDFGLAGPAADVEINVRFINPGGATLAAEVDAESLSETPFSTDLGSDINVSQNTPLEFKATCAPGAEAEAGVYDGTLEFTDSNLATAEDGTFGLPLRCLVAGCITVGADAPDSLDWGDVVCNDEVTNKTFELCNTGTAPLTIDQSDITVSTNLQFELITEIPLTLAAGACADIEVRFLPPTATSNINEVLSLRVAADDVFGDCASSIKVALTASVSGCADEDEGGTTDGDDTGHGDDGGSTGAENGGDPETASGGAEVDENTGGGDDGGGDDGCGCDTTPGRVPNFPLGPLALIVLIGLSVVTLRRRV